MSLREVWHTLDKEILLAELESNHVVHAGLQFKTIQPFDHLQAVTLNWNFLNPYPTSSSYSWKASPHFFAIARVDYEHHGGLDPEFEWSAALAELSYRVLKGGGITKYIPLANADESEPVFLPVSIRDVIRFANLHLGRSNAWLLWLFFLLRFRFTRFPARVTFRAPVVNRGRLFARAKFRSTGDYTAIIPTILRYDYIVHSIESLLVNAYPPREIIVVDQSPRELRNPLVYQPYESRGVLRVFYLEAPGQSVSRNLAIQKATTDWILFFEDDTEAWPGMMEEHRYLMEHSLADVSTGVSLAPWKDESFIPESNRRYHISDILATGNCFMRRETALSVGGLHLAFNRGAGADDDFGRRLFLSGRLIVYNYKAIQTHHKAPSGGMRVHGAWWRNTSRLLEPYPAVPQYFVLLKYYPREYHVFLIFYFYAWLRKRTGLLRYLALVFLSPVKILASKRQAEKLLVELKEGG